MDFLTLVREIQTMSEELVQLRQTVATAIVRLKLTERQYQQSQQYVEEWRHRAILASRSTDKTLTQHALRQRYIHTVASGEIREQLQVHDNNVTALRTKMSILETKLGKAKLVLSEFDGEVDLGDFEQLSRINRPQKPPSGLNGAEANPNIDGQDFPTIP